jgi:hypothetical protein
MDELGEGLLKYYLCGGFTDDQTVQNLDPGSRPGREFENLSNQIKIPKSSQYQATSYVHRVDPEIRKEAEEQDIPTRVKRTLASTKITSYKTQDKEGVKKAQRVLMQAAKETRGQTEKYKKYRMKQVFERERDELREKAGKQKRVMSAAETEEALEAQRLDSRTTAKLTSIIYGGISKLWEGLTEEKYMAHVSTVRELEQAHIVTTREFRVRLANEMVKPDRQNMINWLNFVRVAVDDMIEILEKADKTAFDTRDTR